MMLSSGTLRPTHYLSIRLRRYHMVHGVKVVRWCACFFNISRRENFVRSCPASRKRSSSPQRCGCATRLSDLRLFIQPYRTDVLMTETVLCVHWGPAPVEMISAEIKTIYYSIPPIKHAHQLAVERLVNLTAIVKIVRVRLVAVRPRRARRIARKR